MTNFNNEPYLNIRFISSTKNPLSNREATVALSTVFRTLTDSTYDQVLIQFTKNGPKDITARSKISTFEVNHVAGYKLFQGEAHFNHNIMTHLDLIVFNKRLFYYSINLSLDNTESLKLFMEEMTIQLHITQHTLQNVLVPALTPALIDCIKSHKIMGYIFYKYVVNNSSEIGDLRNLLINDIISDFYKKLPTVYSESKSYVFEMEFSNTDDGKLDYDIIREIIYSVRTTDAVLFFENDKTNFSIELDEYKDPNGTLNISFDIANLRYESNDKFQTLANLLSGMIEIEDNHIIPKASVLELTAAENIFSINFKFDKDKKLIKIEFPGGTQLERYFMFFWANRKFFSISNFVCTNKPRKKYQVPELNILSFIETVNK